MFLVWAQEAQIYGAAPVLTSTRNGLRGLAADHESVHIVKIKEGDIPGRQKYYSRMRSLPRYNPYGSAVTMVAVSPGAQSSIPSTPRPMMDTAVNKIWRWQGIEVTCKLL